MSGSSRDSILSIIAFFVAGGFLLAQVDVAEGQRLARAEEAEALAERTADAQTLAGVAVPAMETIASASGAR